MHILATRGQNAFSPLVAKIRAGDQNFSKLCRSPCQDGSFGMLREEIASGRLFAQNLAKCLENEM